jgi:hypothetical protein
MPGLLLESAVAILTTTSRVKISLAILGLQAPFTTSPVETKSVWCCLSFALSETMTPMHSEDHGWLSQPRGVSSEGGGGN